VFELSSDEPMNIAVWMSDSLYVGLVLSDFGVAKTETEALWLGVITRSASVVPELISSTNEQRPHP
jgi:hypothetical protein